MSWEFSDNTSIYLQIINQIKLMIIAGIYKPGDKLPSVREFAAQAGVNPNTMQKALQELEREELVFSQRTSGRFITEDIEMINSMKIAVARKFSVEFLEKMRSIGFQKEETERFISTIMEEMN